MEESSSSPHEENSSAPLNKKRKSQNEPQESPLSKHVCCDKTPKRDLSSDRESAKDSNSLQCDMDSACNKIGVDSSESGSLATSSTTCTGRIDCFLHLYELQNSTLESDCSCSEYRNDGLENCADSEIENMLCSNGIAPRNYVPSSGRRSVIQDTDQLESKKPTIDQEFEQYFSMLML